MSNKITIPSIKSFKLYQKSIFFLRVPHINYNIHTKHIYTFKNGLI